MLALRDKLTVFHFDGTDYVDHSGACYDFMRDTVEITLDGVDDFLYVGYYKPITALYAMLPTPATAGGALTLELWNGSAWTAVTMVDDTACFSRSGFLRWSRSDVEVGDIDKTTVHNSELYWFRISASQETVATFQGLSLLFCDERDLRVDDPRVSDTDYLRTETTQINALVSARDEIVQELRNKGELVVDIANGLWRDLSSWDLLEVEQVRYAAVNLALSKIYMGLSDREDDVWYVKATLRRQAYESLIKNMLIAVDNNDNGVKDGSETNKVWGTAEMYR